MIQNSMPPAETDGSLNGSCQFIVRKPISCRFSLVGATGGQGGRVSDGAAWLVFMGMGASRGFAGHAR